MDQQFIDFAAKYGYKFTSTDKYLRIDSDIGILVYKYECFITKLVTDVDFLVQIENHFTPNMIGWIVDLLDCDNIDNLSQNLYITLIKKIKIANLYNGNYKIITLHDGNGSGIHQALFYILDTNMNYSNIDYPFGLQFSGNNYGEDSGFLLKHLIETLPYSENLIYLFCSHPCSYEISKKELRERYPNLQKININKYSFVMDTCEGYDVLTNYYKKWITDNVKIPFKITRVKSARRFYATND